MNINLIRIGWYNNQEWAIINPFSSHDCFNTNYNIVHNIIRNNNL